MPTHITFQTTASNSDNPLDLWQIEADLPAGGESFAIDDDDDEAVWSISLPGDMALARQTMENQLDILAERQRATGLTGQFLQTVDMRMVEGDSFNIIDEPAGFLKPYGSEAASLIHTLYHFSELDEAESFAPDWLTKLTRPVADWDDTLKAYRQFMGQAVSLLKPLVRIETETEQVLLAQTIARPEGRLETVWRRRLNPAQMRLHQQTTQLTLETRQALVFFLAQVSAGAASLAVKFYVAQWVALPAAFRFAREVVRRAQEEKLPARINALKGHR